MCIRPPSRRRRRSERPCDATCRRSSADRLHRWWRRSFARSRGPRRSSRSWRPRFNARARRRVDDVLRCHRHHQGDTRLWSGVPPGTHVPPRAGVASASAVRARVCGADRHSSCRTSRAGCDCDAAGCSGIPGRSKRRMGRSGAVKRGSRSRPSHLSRDRRNVWS